MARKPLIGTVAENVLAHGTGAINIDACRVPGTVQKGAGSTGFGAGRDDNYDLGTGRQYTDAGRFPANVIHDGSEEVLQAFPPAPGQIAAASTNPDTRKTQNVYGDLRRGSNGAAPRNDQGTAARFFYSAKASAKDRAGSKHPTVKPIALISYLATLITPPGGVCLDPFAGSGTLAAAWPQSILIEREEEYYNDIMRRLAG
jgi:site-specific DNA-methyltransferase (adenine-specific)